MGMYVDVEALDAVARTLRGAAAGLEGAAGTVPPTVDGGAATAALTGILGRLTGDAGRLAFASAAAADAVREARERYRDGDDAAADGLTAVWGE